jgi:glycosyltransferase involved in cell wall biosynthesis
MISQKENSRRIAYLVTEDWYFCSHRLALGISAKKQGYDVDVVTRFNRHRDQVVSAGLRDVDSPLRRTRMGPLGELLSIWRLYRLYRKGQYKIVHQVGMKPVVYGSLCALACPQIRVVNALGGLGFVFTSNDLRARIIRPLLGLALRWLINGSKGKLILQNPDDIEYCVQRLRVAPEKVVLIRGAGVNMETYRPEDIETALPIVMLASRMLWNKGVGDFVEAAMLLIRSKVQARFVLVGGLDEDNPLCISEVQLRAWQEAGIDWWGSRADMASVLASANIVVLPTTYGEGVPKVLIEAASCAKPIVATNVAGCKEIVRDGENGILVKPRDTEELAGAILVLLNDPQKARQMGQHGRTLVRNEFTEASVISRTLEVYEDVQSLQA